MVLNEFNRSIVQPHLEGGVAYLSSDVYRHFDSYVNSLGILKFFDRRCTYVVNSDGDLDHVRVRVRIRRKLSILFIHWLLKYWDVLEGYECSSDVLYLFFKPDYGVK